MAPAIIAAIISAAASKVKQNQSSAMKMNEGTKTAGNYQISSGNNDNSNGYSYQPVAQSANVGGGGGDLAKALVKEYIDKKMNSGAEAASDAASEAANEAATETAENVAENVTDNIH